jgi:hypothetical protein
MMAIVSIQLTGFGLPAIRDATCMQVNALVALFRCDDAAEVQVEGLDAPEDTAGQHSTAPARLASRMIRNCLYR